ncbi:hypothetical protein P3W85_04200 [Cupriavidus basilensis]|uniref:Uncharacterized protein n=1 Tax=Cupriavidus basilensis TaxID=68895 RepID=A0ABT6AHS0_9BURK|nr:hypothetical protein [Cupriavidus basilensis]MDF3832156.1 hypothetical protein [Cupriavidus basilensis]
MQRLFSMMRTAMNSPAQGAFSALGIHVELTLRGVPPCLRPELTDELTDSSKWPGTFAHDMRYVAWLADLLWLAYQHPDRPQRILYKGLSPIKLPAPLILSDATMGVLHGEGAPDYERPPLEACKPESMTPRARTARNWWAWHARVGNLWRQAHKLQVHKWAWNFGIDSDKSRELGYIICDETQKERKALRRKGHIARDLILEAARAAPDKSRARTPEDVARRRFDLLRIHILAGRSGTRTARYVELVGGVGMVGPQGKPLTRQAIESQLRHVELLTGLPKELQP